MAAVAITQAFAGITLRGSSAGKVATTPISAKAHFGGVRALGKSAFARTAKAQRLQIRAEAEDESAPEAPAAPVASTDEGDALAPEVRSRTNASQNLSCPTSPTPKRTCRAPFFLTRKR